MLDVEHISNSQASPNMPMTRARTRLGSLILLAILILAAALRIFDLQTESLWNDELSSWARSDRDSLAEVIELGVKPDRHPPGYQALLYAEMQLFGESELSLRVPSAIAGTLAVLFVYLIGKRLYCESAGLLAAAILAFSYYPLYYSQEARAYSLLLFSTLATFYYWHQTIDCLTNREKIREWPVLGFILFGLSACYVHYFGLLFVGLLCIYGLLVIRSWAALWRYFLLLTIIIAGYLPWVPSMLWQLLADRENPFDEPVLWPSIIHFAAFAFKMPIALVLVVIMPIFALALLRLGRSTREVIVERRAISDFFLQPDVIVASWIFVPFVVSFIQSHLLAPVFSIRNLIILLPPVYLLYCGTVTGLSRQWISKAWSLVAVLAVAYGTLVINGYYMNVKKEQFREVAQEVLERNAHLPVVAYAWNRRYFDYYFERLGAEARVDLKFSRPFGIERIDRLLARSGQDEFWFIVGHRKPSRAFLASLGERYELVFGMVFNGANIHRYEVR
jgi:4-amino-4-deoxy-L-arabinose transferase-like glycosyltransferase